MGNAWSIAIDTICGALETETKTFLAQPGKVAPLPRDVAAIQAPALRDKPSPDAPQTTPPVNKDAFFTLLKRKAHFFMLPKPIVKFAMESKMVSITETVPERPWAGSAEDAPDRTKPAAEAAYHTSTDREGNVTTTVEMRIPAASDSLANVGRRLGSAFVQKEYAVLDISYHEMTHAWLFLQEFADDSDIQKLYTDGLVAYKDARSNEGTLDSQKAFLEAVGYYVEERVSRWCEALGGLAKVLRDQELPGSTRPKKEDVGLSLAKIAEDYDAPLVMDVIVGGKVIRSPRLSDPACQALRAAIDKKILDGRPLTKPFEDKDAKLVGLRDAAKKKAGL
jgi:hypothetical protein